MSRYYSVPFATAGDKTAIPDASQPAGTISYTDGWGPNYELDQATEPLALDVSRAAENQFKFDVTTLLKEIQDTGVLIYRADADYIVDAHATGSDGNVYHALIANGPTTTVIDPVGDITGTWEQITGMFASGTILFPSVPAGADAGEVSVPHGLGTDDIDFGCSVRAPGAPQAPNVTAVMMGVDSRVIYEGNPNASVATIITEPAVGNLKVDVHNSAGAALSTTVNWWARIRQ